MLLLIANALRQDYLGFYDRGVLSEILFLFFRDIRLASKNSQIGATR